MRTNAAAHRAAAGVFVVAVEAGVMVFIFFQDREFTRWAFMPPFAGRDRTVYCDLIACHQVGALL